MTPALYHLLPGRIGGLTFPPSMPDGSLFGPDAWQPTIIQTISEYIRLRGRDANLTDDQLRVRAQDALQAMLDEGRRHRQRLYRLDLGKAGLKAADWLCVVGVDSETRVRLEIQLDANNTPQFAFHSGDRLNLWGADEPERRWMTGDGTVPLYGSMPSFLSRSNIVCVRPDDFGYWELVDRGLAKASGFHGFIPTMDMLHRMIVRHFTGRPDTRDNTWGRRLPGVPSWEPPLELKEKP